jgi:hypothetical protein
MTQCGWGGDLCGEDAGWVIVYGCPGNHGNEIGVKRYCPTHKGMWMVALGHCFCGTRREWVCQLVSLTPDSGEPSEPRLPSVHRDHDPRMR